MPTAFRASWCRHALGLALVGLVLPGLVNSRPARADMIFLRDGFAIQGQVKREMTLEFDKIGHEMYHMPKGFFFVDDGARRIFFSPSQVRLVYPKDPPIEERIFCKDWRMQVNPKLMPDLIEVVKAPEWDDKWNRRFQFRGPLPPSGLVTLIDVPQHLTLLTPFSARVDSPGKFFWRCYYMTRELGPQTVQTLLSTHPDFQEKKDLAPDKRASLRLRKADFYAQAGWFDLADKELDRALSDLPTQKERIDSARKALHKLRARDRLEEIKHRHLAGQHQLVRKRLADFSIKDVPETLAAEVQELKAEYESTDQLLAETSRLLDKARREVEGPDSKLWSEAAAAIGEELNFENVGRLDAFLGQARQAERFQRKGKKAESTPEQLLSLAVSGWLMGSASAEANPETALRLWNGRQMVLTYLRTDEEAQRLELLRKHTGRSRRESASLDELIQIVRTLPPVEAEKELPTGTVERKTDAGKYLLRLPPEYRHSRSTPVLIVLHNGNSSPKDILDHWAESAAEHGYLLAAPQWGDGVGGGYTYSEGEHALVLSTLRDLRRRFNVDDDRVFLFGLGEGGAMAFDVGLGHPDLFAGVLPMGAGPQFHSEMCWRNGQYLPFYVMHGDRGPRGKQIRQQFENWVYRSFPMIWVDYKGRGVEWFGGELPSMFDWMRSKRRVFPMQQLGTDGGGGTFGNEFCTMRSCDNHFYWLSADDINPACFNSAANWKNRQPASLHARITRENNFIWVKTSGVRKATIWLGRNGKGEDMIDFDKPVTVTANLQARVLNQRLKPSAEVMLEDLYQRGDRQQLFLVKIPLILR
jgi:pimeloyl-ACP methyl ester carboxylesterase